MSFVDLIETTALLGALIWSIVLILPWRPWSTREHLHSVPKLNENEKVDLSELTVLIPARNEADVIQRTLESLRNQGQGLQVVVIDDQSTDSTSAVAQAVTNLKVKVIQGLALPAGWSGKLWALEQGRAHVATPLVMLLDADIEISKDLIWTLLRKLRAERLDMISLMAELKMQTFWEKLLVPAFIYFFKLLYPFSLGNSARSKLGVAAGGCILTKTAALDSIGGFEALKSALIDDCALAFKLKAHGFRNYMGLTHSVKSHRDYSELSQIWKMVARTAFTQLFYSRILLFVVSIVMLSMFVMPTLAVFVTHDWQYKFLISAGLLAMCLTYIPTLQFYRLNPLWSLTMPLIGVLYMFMTWTSAMRYFFGSRSEWRGRVYSKSLQGTDAKVA